jgi:hypothetical protein
MQQTAATDPALDDTGPLTPEDMRYVNRLIQQHQARTRLPLRRCVELTWRRILRESADD